MDLPRTHHKATWLENIILWVLWRIYTIMGLPRTCCRAIWSGNIILWVLQWIYTIMDLLRTLCRAAWSENNILSVLLSLHTIMDSPRRLWEHWWQDVMFSDLQIQVIIWIKCIVILIQIGHSVRRWSHNGTSRGCLGWYGSKRRSRRKNANIKHWERCCGEQRTSCVQELHRTIRKAQK